MELLLVSYLDSLILIEKTTAIEEDVDPILLDKMQTGEPMMMTGIPKREKTVNEAIPERPPQWLKHDRQVLRFSAYFQEHVVEDPTENFRLRKCTIYYYLDDDTFHILEPRVENSGIPQGVFLKRHKVPSEAEGRDYHWSDIAVGREFEVYSRVFKIVSCDAFTRRFY